MNANTELFVDTLARHYATLFASDPEYAYSKAHTTPQALANKMTNGLLTGVANKDGEGVRNTCKELGIKHTYKAIKDYCK